MVSPMASSSVSSAGTDRRRPALGGVAAHEVGCGQGQDAGEQVDSDLVVGAVADRGEGHHVGVFGLAESGFEVFLAAVGVDDGGGWPVVVVGDQDAFAEDLLVQSG